MKFSIKLCPGNFSGIFFFKKKEADFALARVKDLASPRTNFVPWPGYILYPLKAQTAVSFIFYGSVTVTERRKRKE